MFGLDQNALLAWVIALATGLAALYDRLDKRAQRRASESEAQKTVKAQAETIAEKNAEIAYLRSRIDHLELLLYGAGARG